MLRSGLITAAALAFATAAVAGDAATIRIEPRPFYGATITLEEGVRVFRPLPVQKYVVINPENKTPLGLNLTDVKETRHNYNTNNNANYNTFSGSDHSGAHGYPAYVGSPHRGGKGHGGGHGKGGSLGGRSGFSGGGAR